MKFRNYFLVSFAFLFLLHFSIGAETNLTGAQKADICLNESFLLIVDLNSSGFSVVRAGDLYSEAVYLNDAQLANEEKKNGSGDFSLVLKKCEDLQNLNDLAYESRDALGSLLRFYNDSLTAQMDTASVDLIINEIKLEIQNERYEKVSPLIDQAYEGISRVRAENTQVRLFYKTTTSSLKDFLYKHRIEIVVLVSLVILLFLVYRVTIRKLILKRQIDKLNLRKETLKGLIRKTQKEYFQEGSMSESSYNIRVKNFGEMVRDIERQIPLLNEEYLRLSRKVSK